MNQSHADEVDAITAAMEAYATPEPKTRLTDDDLRNITRQRTGSDADSILGDVMQAFGYRDWFQRLSHGDVTMARNDWNFLTPDGRHMRLKWFVGQVEKWAK